MSLEVPRGRPGKETAPSDRTEAESTPAAVWRAASRDALPRPRCRRCDTQLVADFQRKHGLCESHFAEYQAMRALFHAGGAEPATNLQRLPELNTEPLGHAAMFYAGAGIPVHPLLPGRKVPATKNGFKDATTDLQRVRDYWQRHPHHNIGTATGQKFDVLDVDTKDGRPGSESLTRLRIVGLTVGAWAAAATPSGGRHILFVPSGDGNHGNKASGLDFRGIGGYIAAPPSVTPQGVYQWEFADPDARGRAFNWQAAMEHLWGPAPRPEHRPTSEPSDIGGLAAFVQAAAQGERNNALYWAACRAHEDGLPIDQLQAAAEAAGLPAAEAARTIASARHAPRSQP
jgi:hypothetical protein